MQGFLLGMLSAGMEMSARETEAASGLLSIFVGIPLLLAASWECVYRVLSARSGRFELAVLRHGGPDE